MTRTPSVRDRRRRSWALPVGGHGRHYHMATSDTLSCHVLHCGLTRPEAQPTAHRNEWCTVLRSFQRHAPVVAAVRHPSLPKKRQRCLSIADELAMREGIGDEIARGWFLHQELDAVFRWQEHHGVIE